jgi:hypothetical protein
MLISCLGWGSLVWNPGKLPIRGPWFEDGPFLPIEFARQSQDGRITLVLIREVPIPLVRSLWSTLSLSDPDEAREALRDREGIPKRNIEKDIGLWRNDGQPPSNEIEERIEVWAKTLKLDVVIWTNLRPKFQGTDGRIPTAKEVVSHLSALDDLKRKIAEHYIRMAPRQIDTAYRRCIEAELHWTSYRTS